MGLTLTPKQQRAWLMLTDKKLTKIGFFGGKRSGKTDVVLEYMIARGLRFRECDQIIFRKARNAAKASIWNGSLKKYLSRHVPRSWYHLGESDLELTFKATDSRILIGGLDDKDRTEKVFGTEYATVYANEATQISWKTCQDAMTLAAQAPLHIETGRPATPKTILDANPRGPRHWLRRVGIEHVDPKTRKQLAGLHRWGGIHDWTPYDNIANLSPAYIETLEALPDIMKRRMVNGEWVENEGAVYNEFDEDTHVCKDCETRPDFCPRAKKAKKMVGGVDFGYHDPFVFGWHAIDEDGRLLLVRERYKTEVIVEDHAQMIKREPYRLTWTVADHDAEDAATLKRHGVRTRKAHKSGGIRGGIDLVKARLKVQGDGRPRYQVCQFCTNIIGEFYEYIEDEKDNENPLDENNHGMDMTRYVVWECDGKSVPSMV